MFLDISPECDIVKDNMASEILAVSEEYLPVVTKVIRAGLTQVEVPEEVREALEEWCEVEEEYCRYANLK